MSRRLKIAVVVTALFAGCGTDQAEEICARITARLKSKCPALGINSAAETEACAIDLQNLNECEEEGADQFGTVMVCVVDRVECKTWSGPSGALNDSVGRAGERCIEKVVDPEAVVACARRM